MIGDSENKSVGIIERNPVAVWGSLSIFVGAALREFVPDLGGDFVEATVQFIATFGPSIAALIYMRTKVTPVSNPKNDRGEILVPEYVADASGQGTVSKIRIEG